MLLGGTGTWPQHLGAIQKAWHFATHGRSIGKTGRKDRQREGTQDDGMTYVNILILDPKFAPCPAKREQKHHYYPFESPWMVPGKNRGSGGFKPKQGIRNYRKYQF